MSEAVADRAASDEPVRPTFDVRRASLFWFATRMSVYTVLTLGLYRFWMATRLRRYYWSATRLLGDPLEYTGTALEKFLGFLFALVVLAIYLSLVNLGLAFLGLVSFDKPTGIEIQIILNLSVLASLPLVFFATYRARRYLLARTRWRAIRFGMDQAAWAFTWRAMLLSLLTAMTLGLLYPFQNFRLTKFMVDRTWFGDARFRLEGRWLGLMGYWLWVWGLGLGLIICLMILLSRSGEQELTAAGALAVVGALVLMLAVIRYRVAAFRYFWANRAVSGARFENEIGAAEVIGIYFVGLVAVSFFAVLMAAGVTAILTLLWLGIAPAEQLDALRRLSEGVADPNLGWPIFVLAAIAYLSTIAFSSALIQVFIIRPLLRRQVEAMTIRGTAGLAGVRQRAHDEAIEAGGFADALGVDAGAGI